MEIGCPDVQFGSSIICVPFIVNTRASRFVNVIEGWQTSFSGVFALALTGWPFFGVSVAVLVKSCVSQRELLVRSICTVLDPDPLTDQEYFPPVLKLQPKPEPSVAHTAFLSSDRVPCPPPGSA